MATNKAGGVSALMDPRAWEETGVYNLMSDGAEMNPQAELPLPHPAWGAPEGLMGSWLNLGPRSQVSEPVPLGEWRWQKWAGVAPDPASVLWRGRKLREPFEVRIPRFCPAYLPNPLSMLSSVT